MTRSASLSNFNSIRKHLKAPFLQVFGSFHSFSSHLNPYWVLYHMFWLQKVSLCLPTFSCTMTNMKLKNICHIVLISVHIADGVWSQRGCFKQDLHIHVVNTLFFQVFNFAGSSNSWHYIPILIHPKVPLTFKSKTVPLMQRQFCSASSGGLLCVPPVRRRLSHFDSQI